MIRTWIEMDKLLLTVSELNRIEREENRKKTNKNKKQENNLTELSDDSVQEGHVIFHHSCSGNC